MVLAASTGGSFTFVSTPSTLVAGVMIVVATAILAWLGWRRTTARKTLIGWLEVLRVCIALGIALTLNQPEWREQFKPDLKPLLAVLYDTSASMETKDVLQAQAPNAEPKTRAEAIAPFLDKTLWQPLAQRMDVLVQPFNSTQSPPEAGTDINAALSQMTEQHPELRAVVLATDGDWNSGAPPTQAATQLRMKSVPIFTLPAGAETRLPDVSVASFDVPTFGVGGKPLRMPFVLESTLPRDQNLVVTVTTSTGEKLTKEVLLPAMGRVQDSIIWRPAEAGDVKLTLTLPPVEGERFPENNSLQAPVAIRKEELKVLLVESKPRWEYRYMRNAMERDPGVEVHTVLYHTGLDKMGEGRGYLSAFPKKEELSQYDVIFLGDVGLAPGMLTQEQAEDVKRLVRDQASGLVFLPGFHGHQSSLVADASPLAELYPVVLDPAQPKGWGSSSPGRFTLTESGQRSLLTKLEDTDEASAKVWSTLPGFQWYAPAMRSKAGAEVLATHSSESSRHGRVPLLVSKTYGSGKILFMGTDGAWRWRRGVEDKYHYRFWGQVVRWMAYQRNMARGGNLRLFYNPDRPRTGDLLTLNANALSQSGDPLADAVVTAQIAAPSGKTASIRLLSAGVEAQGLFTGTFIPTEPGDHQLRLSCPESGAPLDTVISIQGTAREKLGQPARYDVLRELSSLSRGKLISELSAEEVIQAISALPEPELEERRVLLWAHPLWALTLMLLLAGFWIGRKVAGAF